MVRIQYVHCCDLGSIPGCRTEILQAVQHGQKKKKKKQGFFFHKRGSLDVISSFIHRNMWTVWHLS